MCSAGPAGSVLFRSGQAAERGVSVSALLAGNAVKLDLALIVRSVT